MQCRETEFFSTSHTYSQRTKFANLIHAMSISFTDEEGGDEVEDEYYFEVVNCFSNLYTICSLETNYTTLICRRLTV